MLNIRPLPPGLAKKAVEELNEDPSRIPKDLEAIRQWLAKSPHIKARTDDQFLLAFLRGCKYSLERVKEKLDLFYSIRRAIPEVFAEREPSSARMREIMKLGVVLPLPNTETPDSPRIFLVRPGCYDAEKFAVLETWKVSTMIFEIMMREDDNLMVAGQIGVIDLADVTMTAFVQMTPAVIKRMTVIGQDSSPIRDKGTHFINTPPGFYQIFNIFKTFMTEKNKQRTQVHGDNVEKLFEKIPRRLFPTEYGGEAGSIASIIEYWERKIDEYTDYFIEEETEGYGTDEKKRPGKPKNAETLFGLEGSFRQLAFD
ncbi:LOW QUALITY PROTEIN: alpha-tocopherol transfer protein-like [Culicoides brevitarsis]|uniref:LOW QUALITY PROTEIN: alpha-tocopherol transfer protein-like n=1 Tax=Culicoides brevitarsis TaxID=469753 RepID=UPI00307BF676